ncbi:MAG: FlaD/FlaE family flagellar protein [Candidatus Altiarchaeia archaeon]
MQMPKFSLSRITDKLLGEKPPSASEISVMIQSIQKSAAPSSGSMAVSSDWKANLDEIKKETVKEVDKKITEFQTKMGDIEKNAKEAKEASIETKAKVDAIEKNMKKFLSLYELVTNQVNPFIETPFRRNAEEKNERGELPEEKPASTNGKKISDLIAAAQAEGGYSENGTEDLGKHLIDIKEINPDKKIIIQTEKESGMIDKKRALMLNEKESPIVEKRGINLADLNPEDKKILFQLESINEMSPATGQQTIDLSEDLKSILPLKSIKNDLYSLVTALNWIKYLVEKAGAKGALDILKSYTALNWITPDINQILVKYINGMAGEIEVNGIDKKYAPTMDDHMNSLFFIAKLKGIKIEKEGFDKIVKKWNISGGDLDGG